jgi:bifunctional non-homologous end joining protein LigD
VIAEAASSSPVSPPPAKVPPKGAGWIHEIKHDGFRLLARRDAAGVRLVTRHGNDFTSRFPLIAAVVAALPARLCLIDGEAIVCDEKRLAVFELNQRQRTNAVAVHCSFDLLELDGDDLCQFPIETRKRTLASLLRAAHSGIALNKHFEGEGAIIYKHARGRGCEVIVSKRLGSSYYSGRSEHRVKFKNRTAPVAKREAEEDWGR